MDSLLQGNDKIEFLEPPYIENKNSSLRMNQFVILYIVRERVGRIEGGGNEKALRGGKGLI